VIGAVALVLAILVHLGLIELWHLMAAGVITGSAFAFNIPARQGMLPDTVPEEKLANAVAVNNSLFNLCRVGGPALAGLLLSIDMIGPAGVYDFMGVCYLLAMFSLLRMKIPYAPRDRKSGNVFTEIVASIQFMKDSPVLPVLMAIAFISILIGMPYQSLMPVFALSVLDVGPGGLGMLMTMMGVGALAGSLIVAVMSNSPYRAQLQMFGVIGFGVTLTAFALCQNFIISLILLPFVGGLANMYLSLNNTLIMLHTDRDYLGRVLSFYMLTWSLVPLTTMPISALVDVFGAPIIVACLGFAVTALSLAVTYTNPRYRAAAA
jgi:MFS family permease